MQYQDYYANEHIRRTCHAVKGRYGKRQQEQAIDIIASYFKEQHIIQKGDVIIPAPQKTGYAEYTRIIADKLAILTGSSVLDILRCEPHSGIYERKNTGSAIQLFLYLSGEYPQNKRLFFLDNVISTGMTYRTAQKLFSSPLLPLVYAVDFSRLEDKDILGMLANKDTFSKI